MAKERRELSNKNLRPFEKMPIYKACRYININAKQIRAQMPKGDKYLDGTDLCHECRELQKVAARTYKENNPQRKLALAKHLARMADDVFVTHRICNDNGLMPNVYFEDQSELFESVIKQVTAWIKHLEEQQQGNGELARAGASMTNAAPGAPSPRTASPNTRQKPQGNFRAR